MNNVSASAFKVAHFLLIICFFLVCIIFPCSTVYGEEASSGLHFSYYNELPENQLKEANYFELLVKPGQKQTLKTHLKNETDKKITVQVSVINATTSSQGIINYGSQMKKDSDDTFIRLSDLVEVPNRIVLGPDESKTLEIMMTIPKESFKGVVLGGIKLQELDESTVETTESMSIENTYSYVYSISLKEDKDMPEPHFIGGKSFVRDGEAFVTVINQEPIITRGMIIQSVLMAEESNRIISELSVSDYSMAPASKIEVPIADTRDLEEGNYRTVTTVTLGKKDWKFDDNFRIDKENISLKDTLTETKVKEKTISWLLFMVVIVSFIGISVIVYYLLKRK